MKCQFAIHEDAGERATFHCTRCGYVTVPILNRGQSITRICGLPGWGDRLAYLLVVYFGLTKERVSKLLGRRCHCGKRQEALNDLGAKLGG